MAKPIKLTAALIEQMMKEFAEKLNQMKVSDGEVKYTRSITYKKDAIAKAKVLFEPVAYAKMLSLLMGYSTMVQSTARTTTLSSSPISSSTRRPSMA